MKIQRRIFRRNAAALFLVAAVCLQGASAVYGSGGFASLPPGSLQFHFAPIAWASIATSTPTRSTSQAATIPKTAPVSRKAAPTPLPGEVLGASISPTDTVTHAELTAALDELSNSLKQIVYANLSAPNSLPATGGYTNSIALSNRIDQLSGTKLTNITVDGVSGLTAADIPTGITAANYLSLSGGTLTGALINSGTATSTFAGAVGVGTIAPSSQLDLEGWTVTSDGGTLTGGNPQFQINGTLDTTNTIGHVTGAQWNWNTVGGNSANVNGVRMQLNAGYTGSGLTRVLDAQNLAAGTHALGLLNVYGNIGASIESQGSGAAGDNVGVYGVASNSQHMNVAIYGRSYPTDLAYPSDIANIGVAGLAGIAVSDTSSEIGGYFTLGPGGDWHALLPNSSAAILADIETENAPIFVGRVNHVNAFTISSIGGVQSTSTTDATAFWRVNSQLGKTLLDLDTLNGRAGIGTSTPYARLAIQANNGDLNSVVFAVASSTASATTTLFEIRNNGRIGIGAPAGTQGGALVEISSNAAVARNSLILSNTNGTSVSNSIVFRGSASQFALINDFNNNGTRDFSIRDSSAGATRLFIDSNGLIGLSSTTPWRTLSVTGTVGFDGLTNGFGAGSLCLTANKEVVYNAGSDNCLSSLRSTKHDINPLAVPATSTIVALSPVSFVYNGDASSTVRYGFIAEDTAAVDQHLATYDQSGVLTGVDDRAILSVIVKALQELIATVAGFAESFTTQTLVADNGTFQKMSTQELCVGSTCVTPAQFQAIVSGAGQSSSAPSASTPPAPTTPTPSTSADAATATATATADVPSIVPDYNTTTTLPTVPSSSPPTIASSTAQ